MMNCTLINKDTKEKTIFRQTQGSDMVWVDIYENNEIWKTLGLSEEMAQSLKQHLLENTDSKEDPYHGAKVLYKGKK